MIRMLVVIVTSAGLTFGCNQPASGPRYQIVRANDGTIVRLDTHTGDMRRFVIVIGGDLAAPAQMRIVHDSTAVDGCDELGWVGRAGAREATAIKGGDTVLYGKSQGGTDEAWAYRCSSAIDASKSAEKASGARAPAD